eukprot:2522934-Alexandrium_andersonii.AAC.1
MSSTGSLSSTDTKGWMSPFRRSLLSACLPVMHSPVSTAARRIKRCMVACHSCCPTSIRP